MAESARNVESRPPAATNPTDRRFIRHLLLIIVAGAAAFAVWRLSDVVLLAFGAALLALLLRGLAGALSRRTRIPEAWAVAPVVLALLTVVGAAGLLFGAQVAMQFDLLAEDLPQSISQLAGDLRGTAWGAWLLGQAQ